MFFTESNHKQKTFFLYRSVCFLETSEIFTKIFWPETKTQKSPYQHSKPCDHPSAFRLVPKAHTMFACAKFMKISDYNECRLGECTECPDINMVLSDLKSELRSNKVDKVTFNQWLTTDRCVDYF